MTRRVPQRLIASLSVTLALALAVVVVAAEPAGPNVPSPKGGGVDASPENIVRTSAGMAGEYKKFEEALLRLALRMERSTRPEERERAAALRKAIDLANRENVENRFNKLFTTLVGNKNLTTDDLRKAGGQNEELIKILRDMLELLLTDSELLKKKEEIAKLTALIKQIEGVIKAEKIIQTKADQNRVSSDTIGKEQKNTTQSTESIARQMGNKPNENKKGNEGEPKKGDPKAGQPKDDTGSPKGDMKPGDQKPMDPKAGDPKAGDPKAGDPKAGDPKAGDPKAGDPKAGDPKAGDPKAGDPKPMDPKKPGDPMKPSESKSKPSEQKNKPDNKGEQKGSSGEGKPMEGDPKEGKPSQGKPSQSPPQQQSQSKPNGNQQQQPQQPPPPQQQQPQENANAQKKIQDAIEGQKKVEDDLKKDNKDDASKNIDPVVKALEEAKKELEKRLRQLREEELERLLANLQSRCERMLSMQIEVYEGTKRVHGVVLTYPDKKPTRAEEQRSQQLSTREGDIVKLANSTLQLLSAEGSAVAFAMSLENVRDDMAMIEKRLDKYDSGEMTQHMEEDVIAALKEMIDALKKEQQKMKDQKNQPKPPKDGPPPPQKLLDLLAELKLIRSQQIQINKRTEQYAKQDNNVEQTDVDLLQKELESLGKRQIRLEEMLKKIATGKNQ